MQIGVNELTVNDSAMCVTHNSKQQIFVILVMTWNGAVWRLVNESLLNIVLIESLSTGDHRQVVYCTHREDDDNLKVFADDTKLWTQIASEKCFVHIEHVGLMLLSKIVELCESWRL